MIDTDGRRYMLDEILYLYIYIEREREKDMIDMADYR